MRVSVCASLTYYYTVDVPDSICGTDEEGYVINEAELINFCTDADPINFSGVNDTVTGEIISIRTEDSDEEIYYS